MNPGWCTRAIVAVLAIACGWAVVACSGITDPVDSAIHDTMGLPLPRPQPASAGAAQGGLFETVSACGAGQADSAAACAGFGSGIFISTRGDILTSAHIIDGCPRVAVRGSTGTVYLGRTVAADRAHDLAILHVEGNVPATAAFGLARPVAPAWVAALGFPENRSTLVGATPALGEVLRPGVYGADPDLIPFSAAVMRGSSGGPLVDRSGAVVGVVYAQYNPAPGVFLAVGSAEARRFMDSQWVSYAVADSRVPLAPDDVIRAAAAYTVFVQCLA